MFENIKYRRPTNFYLSLGLIFFCFIFSFLFIKRVHAESNVNLIPASTSSTEFIDSDGDGYSDIEEIKNNYSPYNKKAVRLDKNDADNDGLNDALELKFKTDPLNPDSDSDGHKDGEEVDWGYNPLSSSTKKLAQKIVIDLKKQKLKYLVSDIVLKEFPISSGKASMKTPSGEFKIVNKSKKAWSNTYKLWMPYWLGLGNGSFGIHELPLWPSGYREGASHLGIPVSHGCIRLGIGPAAYLFERVGVGTKVIIN